MEQETVTEASSTVVLLGMHRSGTSALVNFLSDLGFAGPNDPLPAAPDNPDGYGESLAIINANNALLERHGGTWDAPPPPCSPEAQDVDHAQQAFERAYAHLGHQPLVVKDPRLCVLMPTWRAAFGGTLKAVVLFRHPDRVVPSLLHSNRGESQLHSSLHANALWERYNRAMVEGLRHDDDLLFCDFDRLLDDEEYRRRWLELLMAFLPETLEHTLASVTNAFGARFSPTTKIGSSETSVATPQQLALYAELVGMAEANELRPLTCQETPGHDALFALVYAAKVTVPDLSKQLQEVTRQLDEQTEARNYLEDYSANQQRRIEALDDHITRMEHTLSWRITEPLRKVQQRRSKHS